MPYILSKLLTNPARGAKFTILVIQTVHTPWWFIDLQNSHLAKFIFRAVSYINVF